MIGYWGTDGFGKKLRRNNLSEKLRVINRTEEVRNWNNYDTQSGVLE